MAQIAPADFTCVLYQVKEPHLLHLHPGTGLER